MTVEKIMLTPEFDSIIPHEVERKFLPLFPELMEKYRAESAPIEQFYLSHPSEAFNLRFREYLKDGELTYDATLKDTGVITADGLDRMEIPTVQIDAATYSQYRDEATTPLLRKLRAEPVEGVVVDFFEDGHIQVESEDDAAWSEFVVEYGNSFVETTGDRTSDNEWLAHLAFRRANAGDEALLPAPELSTSAITAAIIDTLPHKKPVVVHIGGRSGSGKSTIVRELRAQLEAAGCSSAVLSTDDYHRGTTWLTNYNGGEQWTHWDEPIVYDTTAMAEDLESLKAGCTVYSREIDWTTVEPCFPGVIEPCDVIIIEGIYARAPEITSNGDLVYEMTTPLATCIGRRLLRDLRERPQFADPAESLHYMLTEAEPAYRAQSTNESPVQNL